MANTKMQTPSRVETSGNSSSSVKLRPRSLKIPIKTKLKIPFIVLYFFLLTLLISLASCESETSQTDTNGIQEDIKVDSSQPLQPMKNSHSTNEKIEFLENLTKTETLDLLRCHSDECIKQNVQLKNFYTEKVFEATQDLDFSQKFAGKLLNFALFQANVQKKKVQIEQDQYNESRIRLESEELTRTNTSVLLNLIPFLLLFILPMKLLLEYCSTTIFDSKIKSQIDIYSTKESIQKTPRMPLKPIMENRTYSAYSGHSAPESQVVKRISFISPEKCENTNMQNLRKVRSTSFEGNFADELKAEEEKLRSVERFLGY